MKQNPNDLINDVHDTINDEDVDQTILGGFTEDPTLWGLDKVWLFILEVPALALIEGSRRFLTGEAKLYGYGAAVVLAGLGLLGAIASPGDMDGRSYFEAIVSKYAHQQEMIHDSDPNESRLEQPTNDSLLGRFARLQLVRDWPIIGAGDSDPTQSLVAHKKPFRGGYAIQREDGSLIAGIRVRAIPLRMETTEAKAKAERAVANALEGTVEYAAEWFSTTRVVDYEQRRSKWKDRAREYQGEADRLMSAEGAEATRNAIRKQILADIANERVANIKLDEDTKRIREHYVILSVDPGEAVIDRSSEAGGLGSIPGFGWFVEKYRLWQHSGSEEHVATLIDKLETRADDLERELKGVDGLTPTTLSAVEFSEVIADYYRGTNVRAHDEFTDAIRGAPVPDSEEAGDPEHDVSYRHITNRDRAGSPPSPSPSPSPPSVHAADGGTTPPATDETSTSTSDQRTEEESQ